MATQDSQVNAGLVSSNVGGLQLLYQDDDDADEKHKVDLREGSAANAILWAVYTQLIPYIIQVQSVSS